MTIAALKDWAGSRLEERRQRTALSNEPSEFKLKNKVMIDPKVKPSLGLGYYSFFVKYKDKKFYSQGVTDDIFVRLEKHALELPIGCEITLFEWVRSKDPEFMMVCRRHAAKSVRLDVPETLHGMREVFHANQDHWARATKQSEDMSRMAEN